MTLIELMIVIAIVGILAATATQQYGSYVKRTKYAEVISSALTIKTGITVCLQFTHSVDACDDLSEAGLTLSVLLNDHIDSISVHRSATD